MLGWNKDIPIYDYHSLEVPAEHKEDILKELLLFNITLESLYPGLDTLRGFGVLHRLLPLDMSHPA